ncbi:MAG: hypothetical protein AAF648_10185 [Pseudomonadota bacterium]
MTQIALIIIGVALAAALTLYGVLMHQRVRQLELICRRNSHDVACFADSTLAIGESMEALLRDQREQGAVRWQSPRRLVAQAVHRALDEGASAAEVASRFQLSSDEQRLLGFGRAAPELGRSHSLSPSASPH